MRRRGNMLIFVMMACAILALILVSGVEVAGLSKATTKNQLAVLQLEQLHRSALAEGLNQLNAQGEQVVVGHRIVSDTPLDGQTRLLKVEAVEGRRLVLMSQCELAGGSARTHRVEVLAIPKEKRLGFTSPSQALFLGTVQRALDNRWLFNHVDEDIVLVTEENITIGSGTALTKPLTGSVLITGLEEATVSAVINVDLKVDKHFVCTGNLSLRHDLSCETAWIDGTLTIDEGTRLVADKVYLGEDVPREVLECIQATVYMPHPLKADISEAGEKSPLPDIQPLPDDVHQKTDQQLYLVLQQLD